MIDDFMILTDSECLQFMAARLAEICQGVKIIVLIVLLQFIVKQFNQIKQKSFRKLWRWTK